MKACAQVEQSLWFNTITRFYFYENRNMLGQSYINKTTIYVISNCTNL